MEHLEHFYHRKADGRSKNSLELAGDCEISSGRVERWANGFVTAHGIHIPLFTANESVENCVGLGKDDLDKRSAA
jgi:hypothetical protein